MPTFEIFERSTGNVVETVENPDFEEFHLDFRSRFNSRKYGFRIPSSEPPKPHLRYVIKEDENGEGGWESHLFTMEICLEIATQAGMTMAQVRTALQSGRTIYTNVSRFYLEN